MVYELHGVFLGGGAFCIVEGDLSKLAFRHCQCVHCCFLTSLELCDIPIVCGFIV